MSFAPDGLFEFKTALKKAISGAERYVFIADQACQCQEIMGWLNQRLLERPDLKVILLYGADPDDTPNGLFREAIVNHLLKGLPADSVTGGPRGVVCYGWSDTCVHAKVVIVDDLWCTVGSANCMRRSLYTDVELSIGVLDATDPALGPSFAKRLRRNLWARYCGIPLPGESLLLDFVDARLDELLDLDKALGIWQGHWGACPDDVALRLKPFNVQNLPAAKPYSEADYDVEDADSRQEF